ncbi:MAG: hypothetical protein AB8F34_14620 [Akkermansiaceae bacterium]
MSNSNEFFSATTARIKKIAPASLTLTASILLVSCSNFDAASIVKKPIKSVAKLVPDKMPRLIPQRIPIAEVRTKDLKKMPTGAEKALAFEEKRNRRRFVFIPGLYKAPTLPDERTLPTDAGILPPLRRNQRSTD